QRPPTIAQVVALPRPPCRASAANIPPSARAAVPSYNVLSQTSFLRRRVICRRTRRRFSYSHCRLNDDAISLIFRSKTKNIGHLSVVLERYVTKPSVFHSFRSWLLARVSHSKS